MSEKTTNDVVPVAPTTMPTAPAPKTLMHWTPEQMNLIRATVAKGATEDEFKLFIYRAQHLELDPLVPGLIHFVKYGNNPGTVVVGIDGFRLRASRTAKHNGTKRGVVVDEKGRCIGAWCEVYRKDWAHPAREEVALDEYTTGKAMWGKMPKTMIKKVAEAAALRMAFPDALGGVYADEEMDRAKDEHESRMRDVGSSPAEVSTPPPAAAAPATAIVKKAAPQPSPDPNPKQQAGQTYFQVILAQAERKGITKDELSAYVQKAYKVENAAQMTQDQVRDLHKLMLDEATDVQLLRYLGDPDKFETPFGQPEDAPGPAVPASEPTFQ